MFFDILSHWKPLELEEGYHWWLPFWAAATWTKITAGIFIDLANLLPDNIQRQEINSKHFGGKTGGWLPLVTACVVGYQMSPRLKASTRTHHNRADAHYFPVLELLQPYDALGCLLSRVFWILTRCWVHRQLPLQSQHCCQWCPSRVPSQFRQH